MVEKLYEVLPDCAYTGKHRVYYGGDQFPESEVFGDIGVATKGQKVKTAKTGEDDKQEEVVIIKAKKPVVEVAKTDKRKVKK